ncbi:MAG: alcohol dehydrogenase catalytic domain-containing protein, partial [Acidimicrobiales bacterium]
MTFTALVLDRGDDAITANLAQLDDDQLPAGDVTIDVEWSSLNYKDGLILLGQGRLVRDYPHVPGIDLAGVVTASDDDRYQPGDRVVVTGWRMGEIHWGGYAQRARVPADWVVAIPDSLTTRQ